MNQTPPPSGAAPGGAPQNAPFGAGFFRWIRGLGIGRGGDRWFAGVAGGIAMRAGIDPIIVRGIFVVLAVLGGPGIVLYLAGWLLLPDQGGRIHLEEVFRGRAGTAAVVATVAVGIFVVLPVFFRLLGFTVFGGWSLWNAIGVPDWMSTTIAVFAWIAVIAGVGYLVSRAIMQRGQRVREEAASGAAPGAPMPGAPMPGTPMPGTPMPGGVPMAGVPTTGVPTTGPQWADPHAEAPRASAPPVTDPLPTGPQATVPPAAFAQATAPGSFGSSAPQPAQSDASWTSAPSSPQPPQEWTERLTAGAERVSEQAARWGEDVSKQADDWSAKYAAQHELTKLGAAHVVITLALALLAAGGAAFIAFDLALNSQLVLTAALIAATAVLATSLIIAGVRGRRTGWVGFLAACGVVALLFTSVLPPGSKFQPFGVIEVGMTAPASVLLAGTSELDLTELDGTAGTHDLDVWHLAGRSVVTLPESAPVVVTVRLLAGSVDASKVEQTPSSVAGPLLSRTIDTREDPSEVATRVTVHMLAGSVRIEDASGSRVSSGGSNTGAISNDGAGSEAERRAELRAELAELREEAGDIRAELGEGGLSDVREERLENTLDFTRDEIAKLEKELAR
ncbi:hypothetical protein ACI1US_01061 [Leucobacter sp. BZR 635]